MSEADPKTPAARSSSPSKDRPGILPHAPTRVKRGRSEHRSHFLEQLLTVVPQLYTERRLKLEDMRLL